MKGKGVNVSPSMQPYVAFKLCFLSVISASDYWSSTPSCFSDGHQHYFKEMTAFFVLSSNRANFLTKENIIAVFKCPIVAEIDRSVTQI